MQQLQIIKSCGKEGIYQIKIIEKKWHTYTKIGR
jgi:hypothetical protein